MKRSDGSEVHIATGKDSTKELMIRAMIGLGLWIACLYLIASKI